MYSTPIHSAVPGLFIVPYIELGAREARNANWRGPVDVEIWGTATSVQWTSEEDSPSSTWCNVMCNVQSRVSNPLVMILVYLWCVLMVGWELSAPHTAGPYSTIHVAHLQLYSSPYCTYLLMRGLAVQGEEGSLQVGKEGSHLVPRKSAYIG